MIFNKYDNEKLKWNCKLKVMLFWDPCRFGQIFVKNTKRIWSKYF